MFLDYLFRCLIPISELVEQMDIHWQHWSIITVSLPGVDWLLVALGEELAVGLDNGVAGT